MVDASNLQAALFQRPPTLPVNGDPMTLQGTLLGSTGMANGLSQTLYLLKDQGTVQLKFASPLDWWRGITSSSQHPSTWIGRQVTVLGWLRRAGGQLWLDVSSLQVAGQPPYRVHTPPVDNGVGPCALRLGNLDYLSWRIKPITHLAPRQKKCYISLQKSDTSTLSAR